MTVYIHCAVHCVFEVVPFVNQGAFLPSAGQSVVLELVGGGGGVCGGEGRVLSMTGHFKTCIFSQTPINDSCPSITCQVKKDTKHA